jgi:hypothetical protein
VSTREDENAYLDRASRLAPERLARPSDAPRIAELIA